MSNLTNHNGDIINDRLAERIENLFRDTYRMSEDLQATIQNSVDVCLKDGEEAFYLTTIRLNN
jgi:hypothetical protein